jgi:hypothetical protein
MRLINTTNHRFEEFIGSEIPGYAILSHTWEEGEVSYKDMGSLSFRLMRGWRKIKMACRLAKKAGLEYAWIDTCCIDKSSCAELTEAINSMYRWYGRSSVCYAYLSDLPASSDLNTELPKCRWFERGWTLQELIAPNDVFFYDKGWNCRGSKGDDFFKPLLTNITGIPESILVHSTPVSDLSVAQRMSWAAGRTTTRIEDTAYCLLGIFDINMPLLYGEEEKAFRRLQEDIIKSTADSSIFAWTHPPLSTVSSAPISVRRVYSGVLADSPSRFAACGDFTKIPNHEPGQFSGISAQALRTYIHLIAQPVIKGQTHRYILPLHCCEESKSRLPLGVRLRKCGPSQFVRDDPTKLVEITDDFDPWAPTERYLLTALPPELDIRSPRCSSDSIARMRSGGLQLRLPSTLSLYEAVPWGRWDDEDGLFFVRSMPYGAWDFGSLRFTGTVTVSIQGRKEGLPIDCMFFCIGWGDCERPPHYTLLNYESHCAKINEIQSQLIAWNHDRDAVLRLFTRSNMPKCQAAAFPTSKSGLQALVSCDLSVITSSGLCYSRFWQATFPCTVREAEDVPGMGTW